MEQVTGVLVTQEMTRGRKRKKEREWEEGGEEKGNEI